MEIAFVLIQTKANHEQLVHDQLTRFAEIEEVHRVFGEYDLVAKLVADDIHALAYAVTSRLPGIPGVSSMRTLTRARFGENNVSARLAAR